MECQVSDSLSPTSKLNTQRQTQTLLQLAFLGESDREFPNLDNKVYKIQNTKYKKIIKPLGIRKDLDPRCCSVGVAGEDADV